MALVAGPPHNPSWWGQTGRRGSQERQPSLPCPGRSEASLNIRPALTLSAQAPLGVPDPEPSRGPGPQGWALPQAAGGHCSAGGGGVSSEHRHRAGPPAAVHVY